MTEDESAPLMSKRRAPRSKNQKPTFGPFPGVDYRDVPILDRGAPFVRGDEKSVHGREIHGMFNQAMEAALAPGAVDPLAEAEVALAEILAYRQANGIVAGRPATLGGVAAGAAARETLKQRMDRAIALAEPGVTYDAVAATMTAETGQPITAQQVSSWHVLRGIRRRSAQADSETAKQQVIDLGTKDRTLSTEKIAERVDRDPKMVEGWLRDAGIPRDPLAVRRRGVIERGDLIPTPEQNRAINAYLNGEGLTQTAAALNLSPSTVLEFMERRGVPGRKRLGSGGRAQKFVARFNGRTWFEQPRDAVTPDRTFEYDSVANEWNDVADRSTAALGPSAMASQPADPELVERAVAEFGLTEDPAEAFYVLPDGRMLNASLPGRAGRRIDHDQILRAYDGEGDDRVERRPRSAGERLNYTSYVDDFLERTGAMRWSLGYPSGSLRASVAHPPTRSQQDLVLAEARYVDEVVFEQPGVDPSATQYDMPQDRGRLATDVRRGGAAPLGPSAMASALPDDSRLDAAIRGTAGVHRTPNGIRVEHAARMQTEEQGGQPALRPLHYLLSAEDAREYYTYDPSVAGLQAAGGGVLIDVPKLLRRPYVVETEQYVAAQALWDLFPAAPDGNGTVVDADLRAVLDPFNASGYEVTPELQQATAALAQRYGLDDGYTDTLLGIASRLSPAQRSPFIYDALAEEIAGAELRRQGYDSIIGVSEATGSWVISEIADLQEAASPIPGRPPFLRPEYQQAGPSAMAFDRPFGGSASAYHAAVIQQSPTLQAAAAESAATLRDNLADALSEDELFSFGVDERDQRVIDGFAQFYTSAVIGLAANDAERLDSIGLTPAQAEVERERALDLLGTNERMTALYEAEAAWSVLAGPAYGERLGPSAMAATGPPKLAEPFFSPLLRHTGNLPEIMTGVDEVRTPDRTVPERVVRRANTIRPGETPRPNRDGTVTTVVAPNGDWVQPERTIPGEVTPAMTPGQQALAILVEAGAKPDELTWTGLRQWLTQHTGEQLTRVEVSDYLQDNQVQIEEVLYEGRDARWAGPDYDLLTPGGENQRELLLTLPQSAVADANDRAVAALEAEVAALGLPTNTTEDRIKEAGGTEDLAKRWTRFKLYGDIGLPYDAF
jgi:hypothetical protein